MMRTLVMPHDNGSAGGLQYRYGLGITGPRSVRIVAATGQQPHASAQRGEQQRNY